MRGIYFTRKRIPTWMFCWVGSAGFWRRENPALEMQMFFGKKKDGKLLEEVLAGDTTGDRGSLQHPHTPCSECSSSSPFGMKELLPPPCSGEKIPGKSVRGSLCFLKFSCWDEIWPTHTQCSCFPQNPTGFAEIRTSFHTPYSHSFYLKPNLDIFTHSSQKESTALLGLSFFSPVRPPSAWNPQNRWHSALLQESRAFPTELQAAKEAIL